MKIIFVLFVLGLAVAKETNVKIILGIPAKRGQFPWQALVRGTIKPNKRYICGGSLVTTRWILTAAHCTIAETYEIVLGTLKSAPPFENESLVIKTDKAIVHENYNAVWLRNDIALIDLKQDVQLSAYIQIINLDTKTIGGGVSVTLSGWGQISDESVISPTLNFGQVTTISNNECQKYYKFGLTHGSLCCVGVPLNACGGDSGSPLVKYDKGKNPVQVGIVSFVLGGSCTSELPIVYARTQVYNNWIRSIIRTK